MGAVRPLSHEVDDLLLQLHGLTLVRHLLAERGAPPVDIDAHEVELERVRRRLAGLVTSR